MVFLEWEAPERLCHGVTKLEPRFYQCKFPKQATSAIQGVAVYFQVVGCGLAAHLNFA